MTGKKILFLTTASVATNPRLLKSYLYWRDQGCTCQVIAFRLNNWSDSLDDHLVKKYNLDLLSIPAAKQNHLFWLLASLLNRFLAFFPSSLLSIQFLAYASNKRSWQLMQYLKRNDFAYDHIEAHNLGALYPAYYWSKEKKKTYSFDVEDFHPEEKISFQKDKEKVRRYLLMKKLLPFAKYVTAASPLIAEETQKLIHKKVVTVNNSFLEAEFKSPKNLKINNKLKLLWFSQYISFGRGLEYFLEAAWHYKKHLQICLIGDLNEEFKSKVIVPKQEFIELKPTMPQEDLHAVLADYDIGLALEDGKEDYNREICLTNKIWAYYQAGLFILASKTKAQTQFMEQRPEHGQLISLEKNELTSALKDLIEDKALIQSFKEKRYRKAKTESIEYEMEKLKQLMK